MQYDNEPDPYKNNVRQSAVIERLLCTPCGPLTSYDRAGDVRGEFNKVTESDLRTVHADLINMGGVHIIGYGDEDLLDDPNDEASKFLASCDLNI